MVSSNPPFILFKKWPHKHRCPIWSKHSSLDAQNRIYNIDAWAGIIQRWCITTGMHLSGSMLSSSLWRWSHFLLLLPVPPDKSTHSKPHGSFFSPGSDTMGKPISFYIGPRQTVECSKISITLHPSHTSFIGLFIVAFLSHYQQYLLMWTTLENSSVAFCSSATCVCATVVVFRADIGYSVCVGRKCNCSV